MKIRDRLKKFFFPGPDATIRMLILPYLVLGAVSLIVLSGGIYGWEYTNSPGFCGTTCHTMPPQDAVYKQSPHANVTCEECHIGRASFMNQLTRKSQGLHETYYTIFNLYKYPIRAKALRPARDTCEKCHQPETFSDDSLRMLSRFKNDEQNTLENIYLVMKTGGGAKREGLGRGIHWHIVNTVEYYSTDELSQNIPYVRIHNDDGTTTEYIDVESGFDPAELNESELKIVDCSTCHNRVTHEFAMPEDSVDTAMARGLIDPNIPFIHQKAVDVLFKQYATREEAFAAIDAMGESYKDTDYYAGHSEQIVSAVQALKDIYDRSVFHEQKVDWTTHPNNLGHIKSPGCFRCHDGKHLNAENEAIRLECNVCHSIPVVAGAEDFVTTIEISRGPEPQSHLNPNWIALHNQVFNDTCTACHTMDDPGGTSNTSFCSNSACHGNVFTYAGLDAPALREIIQSQLPQVEPTPGPTTLTESPTFDNYVGALFAAKCTACHGELSTAGLSFLTYSDTMQGSANGPVIVTGDSSGSPLIEVQSKDHFTNLTPTELDIIKQWIDAGAPEQ